MEGSGRSSTNDNMRPMGGQQQQQQRGPGNYLSKTCVYKVDHSLKITSIYKKKMIRHICSQIFKE